jgi:hypothetical protein
VSDAMSELLYADVIWSKLTNPQNCTVRRTDRPRLTSSLRSSSRSREREKQKEKEDERAKDLNRPGVVRQSAPDVVRQLRNF